MRKLTVIILLFLFTGLSVSAQTSANMVAGTISDTISKQNLYKAVISILSAKDSMLVKFARTDLKGHFEIKDLPPGKYVLLTTFPNYADYTDTLTLAANTVADLGRISMITRAHLLQEVIVKQTISAIRMKGDTLEYKADSFHVDANASVEELLKKMPGMQVDKNGQITAQGKKNSESIGGWGRIFWR
jgi:ABC-type microcin C transport system permease subunit YejB